VKTELHDRILALVSLATGAKAEKLQLGKTLSGDLGMEGDDAAEFFEKFGSEFAVDLTDLYRNWSFYFSPEGVPITTALLVAIPPVAIAILLQRFFPRLHGMVALGIAVLLWLPVFVRWSRWRYNNRTLQITIEDLVQSASTGKWTKAVPEELLHRMNKPKFYDRFIAR
jgi:hypothetical protein